MEIRPELQIKQTQKIIMTPQLQQAIKMLQLSNIELNERIELELDKNPALVVDEKENEYAEDLDKLIQRKQTHDDRKTPRYDYEFSDDIFFDGRPFPRINRAAGEDKKNDYLEGTVFREETLREHLIEQFHLLKLTPEELSIGEILINCIDSKGYLSVPLADIAEQFKRPDAPAGGVSETVPGDKPGKGFWHVTGIDLGENPEGKLEEILKIVQTLDPPGVGARDLKECLLIQLRGSSSVVKQDSRALFSLAEKIVNGYLEDLKMNRFEEIAKKLKVTTVRVKEAFSVISRLEPYPGRPFRSEETKYIIPEVIVEQKDGTFEVKPNSSSIPRLKVDGYFEWLARKKAAEKGLRDFVTDKVQAARQFIHSIEQRESTLIRVSKTILEAQKEFFEKGPKYLKPLTLKDISGSLDLHESTISRITSSKYVQTPFGVFPLKYFFSNSIPAQGNRVISSTVIKEEIKDIIEMEGGKKHLSDQKIANILAKRGIKIARRTIAKYRKDLRILPSNLRR